LEHFYYDDRDTYIIPASGGIATLGGTRNYGSWNLEPSKHDTASIQERAARILPRMASAPILRTWVGLRPYRDVVRVEPDFISGIKVN
jgi:glycine/D-amino acid oxidase-like deaminating enzyme